MPATEHGKQALPVETKKNAFRLGVYGGLLTSVQHAGSFADKMTGGEDRDGERSGRPLHDHATTALLDEEARVARVTLENGHLRAGNPDPPPAAGQGAAQRTR